MKRPKESRAIYRKLRTIAKGGEVFRVGSCIIQFSLGKHFTDDWQECIDKLIAKGELEEAKGGYRLRRKQ